MTTNYDISTTIITPFLCTIVYIGSFIPFYLNTVHSELYNTAYVSIDRERPLFGINLKLRDQFGIINFFDRFTLRNDKSLTYIMRIEYSELIKLKSQFKNFCHNDLHNKFSFYKLCDVVLVWYFRSVFGKSP